jgi:hypothetical protein
MSGTLVSIITGGRPALTDRPTRQFTDTLHAAGLTDVEWVIRSDQAPAYERDDLPLNIYPVTWADTYARAHWRHPTAIWEPGGFFGAFPGREWAMRTAEDRGYEAVLQLDDNLDVLGLLNANQPALRSVMNPGQLLLLLTELCLSTNTHMIGAQLSSVVPKGYTTLVRPGYPYSAFVEKTGPGRMPYHGPFEDDIMHALEYALHGGPGRTAAVVDVIRYNKEHKARAGGMRSRYDASRGLGIANRYPQNVRIGMGPRTSGSKDAARGVRHFLNTRGFTPVLVTDPARFTAADATLRTGVAAALEAKRAWDREKISRRATRGAARA